MRSNKPYATLRLVRIPREENPPKEVPGILVFCQAALVVLAAICLVATLVFLVQAAKVGLDHQNDYVIYALTALLAAAAASWAAAIITNRGSAEKERNNEASP